MTSFLFHLVLLGFLAAASGKPQLSPPSLPSVPAAPSVPSAPSLPNSPMSPSTLGAMSSSALEAFCKMDLSKMPPADQLRSNMLCAGGLPKPPSAPGGSAEVAPGSLESLGKLPSGLPSPSNSLEAPSLPKPPSMPSAPNLAPPSLGLSEYYDY